MASKPEPLPTCGNLALDPAWRDELARRVEAFRLRRRRGAAPQNQGHLPFEANRPDPAEGGVCAAESAGDPGPALESEDFAFTIAIGRRASSQASAARGLDRIDIDLTAVPPPEGWQPSAGSGEEGALDRERRSVAAFLPVVPLARRRLAALVDALCLLFSYGGFLMLFGSLGGQFSLGKLSAIVYAATLALFYIQYFALFTVLGGATPGMMFCGLQVARFDGESPTPRQLLVRSLGYVLSAGTFFLGFLWACWDEDRLTWHDRISRTYLAPAERPAETCPAEAAQGR